MHHRGRQNRSTNDRQLTGLQAKPLGKLHEPIIELGRLAHQLDQLLPVRPAPCT